MPPKKRNRSVEAAKSTKEAKVEVKDDLKYLSGFDGHHQSEALPNALPTRGNTPQKYPFLPRFSYIFIFDRCAYGLIAEQLSGSSFTSPRTTNKRTWLYRIQPSCLHDPMVACESDGKRIVADFANMHIEPNQTRWSPFPFPNTPTDFVQGLTTIAGVYSPAVFTPRFIVVF
jgi:homogentisate 1,2-dioxygenase